MHIASVCTNQFAMLHFSQGMPLPSVFHDRQSNPSISPLFLSPHLIHVLIRYSLFQSFTCVLHPIFPFSLFFSCCYADLYTTLCVASVSRCFQTTNLPMSSPPASFFYLSVCLLSFCSTTFSLFLFELFLCSLSLSRLFSFLFITISCLLSLLSSLSFVLF